MYSRKWSQMARARGTDGSRVRRGACRRPSTPLSLSYKHKVTLRGFKQGWVTEGKSEQKDHSVFLKWLSESPWPSCVPWSPTWASGPMGLVVAPGSSGVGGAWPLSPSPAARSEAQATSALCSPCGWLVGLRHLGPVLRGAGGAAGPSQEGLWDSHLSVVLKAHFSLFLPFVLALGPVRRTSLQGSFPPPPHFPSPLPFPTFLLGCEVGLFATEGCWGDQLLFWTLPFSP